MAAHEPDGVTTSGLFAKAWMVCLASSRASWWKPLLKCGWPQQVCDPGKSTATPRRRNSFTVATPTSGNRASPRQVIIRETCKEAVLECSNHRGEIRNTKSEIRNKSEMRSTKQGP